MLLGRVYLSFGARSTRIYRRSDEVKTGLTRQQFTQVLPPPDTGHSWELDRGRALVLPYDLGFPDTLRIFIEHDTVTVVVYNQ